MYSKLWVYRKISVEASRKAITRAAVCSSFEDPVRRAASKVSLLGHHSVCMISREEELLQRASDGVEAR